MSRSRDDGQVSTEACAELLRNRLVGQSGMLRDCPQGLVEEGLLYLSLNALFLRGGGVPHIVNPFSTLVGTEVLSVLPALREATDYRGFLGEWIRGELHWSVRYPDESEVTLSTALTTARTAFLDELPGFAEGEDPVVPDSPRWWERVAQVLGFRRPRISFQRGISGTPGVVSFTSKDESPE